MEDDVCLDVLVSWLPGRLFIFVLWDSRGARKKKESTPTYYIKRFSQPFQRGEGCPKTPSPPFIDIISQVNNPILILIIKGQRGYIADTQPPGRTAAACASAMHSAEQRRKRERANESGHNEHSLHGEGTPATTLLRQGRFATKRRRKASRRRGFICCCEANFDDGSGMDAGQDIEHECPVQHRE